MWEHFPARTEPPWCPPRAPPRLLSPRILSAAACSLGFSSLTSVAYRRVIRVCQYEVGDDLSGRFFSLFLFFPHCACTVHPGTPGAPLPD